MVVCFKDAVTTGDVMSIFSKYYGQYCPTSDYFASQSENIVCVYINIVDTSH